MSNIDYIKLFRCPVPDQRYIWYGKYNDDSMVYEFDNNGIETNFTEIKKEDLTSFGLMGNGGRVYFDVNDGLIHLDTTRVLNLYLLDENDDKIKITEIPDYKYNDIIQYKKGYMDFRYGRGIQEGKIKASEHFMGYKVDLKDKENTIKAQVIYCLPVRGTIHLIMKLNSIDRDFNGKLVAQYGGNRDEAPLNLSKNTLNEFRINL